MEDIDLSILDAIPKRADPPGILPTYHKLEKDMRHNARCREAVEKQAEAIAKSERLRVEITKGIQAGESQTRLLLKAIECISLITGDKPFLEQNRKDLITIYGIGLNDAVPLAIVLAEVEQRLTMLTRPELEREPEDDRARIRRAIVAHENRIAELRHKSG